MEDLSELKALEPFAADSEFCRKFREVKHINKEEFAAYLGQTCDHTFRPLFMLDCQVKRMHEYKRQMLNVLHAITLYNRLREGRVDETFIPRTILFAGKSAPGYWLCKLIIKLIHAIAETVANNPTVREKAAGDFCAELFGLARPALSCPLPSFPSRYPLPGLKHPARQHEIHAERRPYHRYARRCQCRDSSGSG